MGVDFLAGAILSTQALLFLWIGDRLAARWHRGLQVALSVLGFLVGLAVGYALNALLFLVLLNMHTVPGGSAATLSWIAFIVPWLLIYLSVRERVAHKSPEYRAIASFLALITAAAVGLAVQYLFLLLLYGHAVSTRLSLAYLSGILAGLVYMTLLIRVIAQLAPPAAPPSLESSAADGSVLGR